MKILLLVLATSFTASLASPSAHAEVSVSDSALRALMAMNPNIQTSHEVPAKVRLNVLLAQLMLTRTSADGVTNLATVTNVCKPGRSSSRVKCFLLVVNNPYTVGEEGAYRPTATEEETGRADQFEYEFDTKTNQVIGSVTYHFVG